VQIVDARRALEAGSDCISICPTGALSVQRDQSGLPELVLDPNACIGCGLCVLACPSGTVRMSNEFGLASRPRRQQVTSVPAADAEAEAAGGDQR
jgi:Fe-S-cluster-containing hydrogenase component 2